MGRLYLLKYSTSMYRYVDYKIMHSVLHCWQISQEHGFHPTAFLSDSVCSLESFERDHYVAVVIL